MYTTNADIEKRLGTALYVQLTDDEGTGSADEERVTEARLAAEGTVDSRLGRRYAVPVDTSQDVALAALLKSVAVDLVEYRLHARRPPVPADIERKHQAAIEWLVQVAAGLAVLPTASGLPANAAEGPRAAACGPPRVLSREELEAL